jgi:ribosomal protein L37AE/L43A
MAICKQCQNSFTPKKKSQIYCCDKCRKTWYDENYFNRVPTMMECPVCKSSFETTKVGQQIYCSEDCRKTAQERIKFGLSVDTPLVGAGICEICGKDYKVRGLHHHVNMCLGCYTMATRVDKGYVANYLKLAIERVTPDDEWS